MMICTQTDYGRRPFEQLTMIIRNKIAFALLFILLHYCSCDVRNLVELPSYEIKSAVYISFFFWYIVIGYFLFCCGQCGLHLNSQICTNYFLS